MTLWYVDNISNIKTASPQANPDCAQGPLDDTSHIGLITFLNPPSAVFAMVLAAGVTLTWSASTQLNGRWDCDRQTQNEINAEVAALLLNGVFTNGENTRSWLDYNSQPHTFTVVQFKIFAAVVGTYVDSCYDILTGGAAPPTNVSVTG